jgi:glutamyl-tRNA reductase
MNILLVGLNHVTAPVELREQLALDRSDPAELYRRLRGPDGGSESVILSTCNRVEVLLATPAEPAAAVEAVKTLLADQSGVAAQDLAPLLYAHEGREAVRHVFRVASSLDSMVLGEPQILGQVKDAYRQAVSLRASGVITNKLLHKSFSVAKRVRSETGVASHAVSVGYAAVELTRKIFGRLEGLEVLLIGAGEMAESAAEHLLRHHASRIVVANRTLPRAMDLARRFQGRAAHLDELPALLITADVVISSTGSEQVVITSDVVKAVLKPRRHRPLFFVDIAVPRDVDPEVNGLSNVYLYDIDDLAGVVAANRAARADESIRAERIVEEETLKFMAWLETLAVAPTIIDLKNKAEEIRTAELKRTLARMGPLSEQQVETLEVLTRSLMQKIIHDPILFIKHAGHRDRKDQYLELARKLFNLDREDDPGPNRKR